MYCEWFARCDRDADGVREHPTLGALPICARCADTVGEPLTTAERALVHPRPADVDAAEHAAQFAGHPWDGIPES